MWGERDIGECAEINKGSQHITDTSNVERCVPSGQLEIKVLSEGQVQNYVSRTKIHLETKVRKQVLS